MILWKSICIVSVNLSIDLNADRHRSQFQFDQTAIKQQLPVA